MSRGRSLAPADTFARRHLGSDDEAIAGLLETVGADSLAALIDQTVPAAIRAAEPLDLAPTEDFPGERPLAESELLEALRRMADDNRIFRSFIGLGYHRTLTPPVIQRNVLENPGWYTQYTPYQSEISQGRLEALFVFQTAVADLTGLPVANASLLDEATAAAEAMAMCHAVLRGKRRAFWVSDDCHPQTVAVVETRAAMLGIEVRRGPAADFEPAEDLFGVLLQYPTSDGRVLDYGPAVERAHECGALVVMAADLLALTLLRSPGELGADVAVGSAQRFGVPIGFGGPHAAYLATGEEHKRRIPGRIIGLSRDAAGADAYRMAMQTREQHIRREKATSNICTAQVLLAVMAGFYAVYHGPEGLARIARRVRAATGALAVGLERLGYRLPAEPYFDTLRVGMPDGVDPEAVHRAAAAREIDLRRFAGGEGGGEAVGVTLDEATRERDVADLLATFAEAGGASGARGGGAGAPDPEGLAAEADLTLPAALERGTPYLTHPVFHLYRTEHEMLRYIKRLEARDLSLTRSMIPLGSCTMKLNASAEMLPLSYRGWSSPHPFAPAARTAGYRRLIASLEIWLCQITGFAGCSLQPNAGSQGEFTGLSVIRAYHRDRGDEGRDICLIPVSAHGTNPASAVMAGLRVVAVACDDDGNIDVEDLAAKAAEHADRLAAIMVTYPSTHGVFEARIREVCDVVHRHGGQVYLDGANLNAQVGLCRPGDYGADVCHLNLHKTFCIPHGGGGPGVGPVCAADHLVPFLPGHPLVLVGGEKAIGPVAAAPWGSASILTISWAYIAMMGGRGLTRASELAILNANYMAARLGEHYPVLYRGENGRVAHELILDLRPFKGSAGVEAEDVAKRLMDYGFHAPTMSFPVAGTLMIEPTESETRAELDRLCDALVAIREEIRDIEQERLPRDDNPLVNAPHTAEAVTADDWSHPYSRAVAAFPAPWVRESKFWPAVARVDNAWGDRNLICACPPMEEYVDAASADAASADAASDDTASADTSRTEEGASPAEREPAPVGG